MEMYRRLLGWVQARVDAKVDPYHAGPLRPLEVYQRSYYDRRQDSRVPAVTRLIAFLFLALVPTGATVFTARAGRMLHSAYQPQRTESDRVYTPTLSAVDRLRLEYAIADDFAKSRWASIIVLTLGAYNLTNLGTDSLGLGPLGVVVFVAFFLLAVRTALVAHAMRVRVRREARELHRRGHEAEPWRWPLAEGHRAACVQLDA